MMKEFIEELRLDIKASSRFMSELIWEAQVQGNIDQTKLARFAARDFDLEQLELMDLYASCGLTESAMYRAMARALAIGQRMQDGVFLARGEVVGFWSLKGGSGVTTQAMLFANEISRNFKVLYLDASAPKSAAALRDSDLSERPDFIVPYEIQRISLSDVAHQIRRVQKYYDYIVLDLGRFSSHHSEYREILDLSNVVITPFFYKNLLEDRDWQSFLNNFEGMLVDFLSFLGNNREDRIGRPNIFLMPLGKPLPAFVVEELSNYMIFVFPFVCPIYYELNRLDTLHSLSEDEELRDAPYQTDLRKHLYSLKYCTGALKSNNP